jgi:hypothetical protein
MNCRATAAEYRGRSRIGIQCGQRNARHVHVDVQTGHQKSSTINAERRPAAAGRLTSTRATVVRMNPPNCIRVVEYGSVTMFTPGRDVHDGSPPRKKGGEVFDIWAILAPKVTSDSLKHKDLENRANLPGGSVVQSKIVVSRATDNVDRP